LPEKSPGPTQKSLFDAPALNLQQSKFINVIFVFIVDWTNHSSEAEGALNVNVRSITQEIGILGSKPVTHVLVFQRGVFVNMVGNIQSRPCFGQRVVEICIRSRGSIRLR